MRRASTQRHRATVATERRLCPLEPLAARMCAQCVRKSANSPPAPARAAGWHWSRRGHRCPPRPSTPVRCTRTLCEKHQGECPNCGMALEPITVTLEEEQNPELIDMKRRFWVSAALTVPLVIIAMGEVVGASFGWLGSPRILSWYELALGTPVVLWGGWPFFVRGWQSVVNRSLNMFTLIGLGTGVAYGYSLVATAVPGVFPVSFRDVHGEVAVYFEAAAAIVTLVLLGQVMELRARSRTGAAIRALLGLAPKTAPAR